MDFRDWVGVVGPILVIAIAAWVFRPKGVKQMIEDHLTHGGEVITVIRMDPELVPVIAAWCGGVVVEEIDPETGERFLALNVQCQNEVKRASLGDYVIKRENGRFDVQKPNEFSSQLHDH